MARSESRKTARAPRRSASNAKQQTLDQLRVSCIPRGDKSAEAPAASAVLFVREAYKHCKAIAAMDSPAPAAPSPGRGKSAPAAGNDAIVVGTDAQIESIAQGFIRAIARHRDWSRAAKAQRAPA